MKKSLKKMKIPKTFVPDNDLEEKVKVLLKGNHKNSKKLNYNKSSFIKIQKRVTPILENFVKTVYGKDSLNIIQLEGIPDPYKGWIDFFETNYKSERYYCTMFDLQSEDGVELRKKFANSQREYHTYYFKPNDSFEVKGRLIKKGYTNGFKWYILSTDEKRN